MWMAACRSGPGASWLGLLGQQLARPRRPHLRLPVGDPQPRAQPRPRGDRPVGEDRTPAVHRTDHPAALRLHPAHQRMHHSTSASCSPSDSASTSTSDSAATPASSSRTAAATPPVEPMYETYQPGPTLLRRSTTVHSGRVVFQWNRVLHRSWHRGDCRAAGRGDGHHRLARRTAARLRGPEPGLRGTDRTARHLARPARRRGRGRGLTAKSYRSVVTSRPIILSCAIGPHWRESTDTARSSRYSRPSWQAIRSPGRPTIRLIAVTDPPSDTSMANSHRLARHIPDGQHELVHQYAGQQHRRRDDRDPASQPYRHRGHPACRGPLAPPFPEGYPDPAGRPAHRLPCADGLVELGEDRFTPGQTSLGPSAYHPGEDLVREPARPHDVIPSALPLAADRVTAGRERSRSRASSAPSAVRRYMCRGGRPAAAAGSQRVSSSSRSARRIRIGYSVPDASPVSWLRS